MSDEQAKLAETLDAEPYEPPKPKRRRTTGYLVALLLALAFGVFWIVKPRNDQRDIDTPNQAEDLLLLKEHLPGIPTLSAGKIYTWKRMRYAFASSDSSVCIRVDSNDMPEASKILGLGFAESKTDPSSLGLHFEYFMGPSWWQQGSVDAAEEAAGVDNIALFRRGTYDALIFLKKSRRTYYCGSFYRDR